MPDLDGTEWSKNVTRADEWQAVSPAVVKAARRITDALDAMDHPEPIRWTANMDLQWQQHYTPDAGSGVGTIHYERHGTYSEYITLAEAQRRGIHS